MTREESRGPNGHNMSGGGLCLPRSQEIERTIEILEGVDETRLRVAILQRDLMDARAQLAVGAELRDVLEAEAADLRREVSALRGRLLDERQARKQTFKKRRRSEKKGRKR